MSCRVLRGIRFTGRTRSVRIFFFYGRPRRALFRRHWSPVRTSPCMFIAPGRSRVRQCGKLNGRGFFSFPPPPMGRKSRRDIIPVGTLEAEKDALRYYYYTGLVKSSNVVGCDPTAMVLYYWATVTRGNDTGSKI